jgi:hypothetical protein
MYSSYSNLSPVPGCRLRKKKAGRKPYVKHAVHIARQKYAIYVREYTIYRNKYIATLREAFQDIRDDLKQRREKREHIRLPLHWYNQSLVQSSHNRFIINSTTNEARCRGNNKKLQHQT